VQLSRCQRLGTDRLIDKKSVILVLTVLEAIAFRHISSRNATLAECRGEIDCALA
jgi:hypothetical protein